VVRIHNAFWIKLARLSATLQELDQQVADLEALERSGEWRTLSERTQRKLRDLRATLEEIRSLD
jgi:hypothetical protein